MSVPIPQPRGLPIMGNVTDIDPENSIESLKLIAAKLGPIFKLNFVGRDQYFVTTVELVNELCDEKRFHKSVDGGLEILRAGGGDGLFTAYHGEHNWGVAHRVLVPAFGPLGIRNMFDEMKDIAVQLIQKWARTTERVNVTEDFTRLTLDTIALTSMDMRLNSFYSEKLNPFVDAMVSFLAEGGERNTKSKLEIALRRSKARKFQQDIDLMKKIGQDVIDRRKEHPVDKKDLLNAMLYGKDPKTGEGMTDESIINNMLTFLIAGHETTSGLLSFATYYLLKSPMALRKAQAEVDEVVGSKSVQFEHMPKLPYLEAVLRESLRLNPTAPAFAVETNGGPELLGGKYLVPPGRPIICLLPCSGRDPLVYGPDAEEFRPERMMGEEFAKLPSGAWKPFGNGARGCIGRPLAWQEALLALALILQNFDLRLDNPTYVLRNKETLTLKPDAFYIRTVLRNNMSPIKLEKRLFSGDEPKSTQSLPRSRPGSMIGAKKPILVLYGSNSGTCEGLAHAFAANAAAHDFDAQTQPMDNMVRHLPKDRPVLLITASYEGAAPDNATAFCEWIRDDSVTFDGLRYAVFGCGHRDWVSTYQKVPMVLDKQLHAKGAQKIADRGECDVSKGTIFNDFDQWQDDVFWPQLTGERTASHQDLLDVQISTATRASHLNHNLQDALVMSNSLLTAEASSEMRHIQFRLPTKLSYEAGDYMAVLPVNSSEQVSRVLQQFNLAWDAVIILRGNTHSFLPKQTELPVTMVLGSYVELGTPATRKNLSTIAAFASESVGSNVTVESLCKNIPSPSVLDILEINPDFKISFGIFLSMLQPMRIRQYSISSSPLTSPNIASITFTLASKDERHPGVATNYLKSLRPGSKANVMIKRSHAAFHLPVNERTPILMACAGSGIAPFRGFVQERVAKIEGGRTDIAPALLFIGCRHPNLDQLFRSELENAERMGAVKLFYAFSKCTSESEGCRYVQDRIWHERELVTKLFDQGAQAYICGSSDMGKGIKDVVIQVFIESEKQEGRSCTSEEGSVWWEALRNERYALDVFD